MELGTEKKETVIDELGWRRRADVPKRLRLTDHQQSGLSQAFEHCEIALIKREAVRRENFNQSNHAALVADGRGRDRTNSQLAARLRSDTVIGDGIIAPQSLSRAYTFTRKSRIDVYPGAEGWASASNTGATHHRSAIHEGDGRTTPSQKSSRTIADDTQCRIEIRPE